MQNHYFDDTKLLRPYTHSAPANPGTLPPVNAVRGEKPEKTAGYWPCWTGKKWEQAQDLRGTEYYIRNAEGQIEAKTIGEIGETVPEDGYLSIEAVPLTEAEKSAKRQAEIKARLNQIDIDSVRPLRALSANEASQADHDKLSALASEASVLREQLATLTAKMEL